MAIKDNKQRGRGAPSAVLGSRLGDPPIAFRAPPTAARRACSMQGVVSGQHTAQSDGGPYNLTYACIPACEVGHRLYLKPCMPFIGNAATSAAKVASTQYAWSACGASTASPAFIFSEPVPGDLQVQHGFARRLGNKGEWQSDVFFSATASLRVTADRTSRIYQHALLVSSRCDARSVEHAGQWSLQATLLQMVFCARACCSETCMHLKLCELACICILHSSIELLHLSC